MTMSFRPLVGFSSGHAQTLAAYCFPFNPFLSHKTQHILTLADGDKIVLVENRPTHWQPTSRTILLVHGITGSHRSAYLIRITQHLLREGYRVIRMNLRGCGPGMGLAQRLYHSGRSEDTRAVIYWLQQQFPLSPVTQIGFSLGANITLKMAGEDGHQPSGNLDSIMAISPPLDLYASAQKIIHTIFDKPIVKALRLDVKNLQSAFPALSLPTLPENINLYDFDNIYTAPLNHFKNARDYYTQCSSGQFVPQIDIPTFILHAQDDPLIAAQPFNALPQKPNLDILITQQGGHMGWIGPTIKPYYFRWMDYTIVEWLKRFDKKI